jgi:hypothetical protein
MPNPVSLPSLFRAETSSALLAVTEQESHMAAAVNTESQPLTGEALDKEAQAYTLGKEAGKSFYGEPANLPNAHFRHYRAIADLCTDEDDERTEHLSKSWLLGIQFARQEVLEGREVALDYQAFNLDPDLPMEPENVAAFLAGEAEFVAEEEEAGASSLSFLPLVNDAAQERNRDRVKDGEYPCLLCGKGCTQNGKAYSFLLGGGGVRVLTEEEYTRQEAIAQATGEDQGLMGTYPIGPECYRKHRAALQPYVQGRY